MSAGLAGLLAERALAPLTDDEARQLRTLSLTNVAAAVGDRGAIGRTIAAFPLDLDRAADAAFVLAARMHARTQDDFYPEGRVHVGAIVLAATLALADATGDAVLPALAAGYRVMCDTSGAYSTAAQTRGLRPSGVFGPMGAAAAAAVALGFDAAGTAGAIALAAAACGGHNQAWISSTDEWILEVGAAARAGVEAALFLRAGARASAEAFEGRAGWGAAFFGEPGAPRLAEQLAGPPATASLVAVKPYPVSGIAQVPTDLACRAHEELAGREAIAVRVAMSPIEFAYPGSANTGPFTSRSGALMSVAFCVACGLLDGAVPLGRLERPDSDDLTSLLARVTVAPDEALEENVATLEVDTADGATVRLRGAAAELLFPSWTAAVAEVDNVARRSEADPDLVTATAVELGRERPQAKVLRDLLLHGPEVTR